jgi:sigma-B regulation protein RsbU (phosphoserine phosphatase)
MFGDGGVGESMDSTVNQLKQCEEMLQEAISDRKHLEAIVDALPSGLVVAEGPDAGITIVNPRALEIFGWSKKEGVQKPEHSSELNLLKPDGSPFPPEEQPLSRATIYGEVLRGEEVLIKHSDGTIITAIANAAPLYDGGKIIGAVGAFEEITALKAVQEALRKAYSRERRVSTMLQKALLPNIPDRMDGLLIASEYRPAYKGDYMGGDFYDIFSPEPDKIAIIIGDVSGKGIQGAIRTALTKYTLRAYAYENPSPSAVMERTNNTMYSQSEAEAFVTVFYGLLSIDERTLTFANAGHEFPLLFRHSGGDVSELAASGMALGVRRNNTYPEGSIQLEHGDQILFYTDGTTDARKGDEFFGIDRLKALLIEKASEAPKDFTAQLVQALLEFSDGRLQDDVAILTIHAE